MAGAGQPWYMPLLWPVAHVTNAIFKPETEKVPKNVAVAKLDVIGHLTAIFAALRSFTLAYVAIYWLYDDFDYPAFGAGKTLDWNWMRPILVRNTIVTLVTCGFWDWFLYFSPLKDKLHKYKMNPTIPSLKQFRHDAFYTTLASLQAGGLEIAMCWAWSNGYLPMKHRQLSEAPFTYAFLTATITHWRIPHFYFIHRFMHPWRIKGVPDVGKFVYRHVHSLHHKSYNPTAFSGTSMHPVEATLYYTAGCMPALFGFHPVLALGCIADCAFGAWLGHDGFQWPGSGDYFHNLHHKHFDCNYGAMHVPMDYWFGTYAGGKEDIATIWRGGEKAGEEANETTVHEASSIKKQS